MPKYVHFDASVYLA